MKNIVLLKIIMSTFKVVFFSFGGGMAVIPLIYEEFIKKHNLMPEETFNKAVVLANTLPGPTVLQLITHISYYSASYIGAIISFSILLFTGPLLLVFLLIVIKQNIPQEILTKFALGIIPAIVALLLEFSLKLFKSDIQKKYNWSFYILILFLSIFLLALGVNFAFVVILIIVLLSIFRYSNINL